MLLVSLAQVSPVDPLWIEGIYDGADLDALVYAVTTLAGSIAHNLPTITRILVRSVIPQSICLKDADMIRTDLCARAPPDLDAPELLVRML